MTDTSLLAQKSAVRFTKTGPAIYHSHHDMIRFWERAVKRAGIPMRLTQGFNPRPRMVFPHALGLGIVSRHEEVELELHTPVDSGEMRRRLAEACGGTLEVLSVQNLPPVKKSRQIVESAYRITGWPAGASLEAAATDILARTEIPVERGAPGQRRTAEIRSHLKSLTVAPEGDALILVLTHSQTGSARPDEIARLAAELTGTDWRDLGIEKTAMRLE